MSIIDGLLVVSATFAVTAFLFLAFVLHVVRGNDA